MPARDSAPAACSSARRGVAGRPPKADCVSGSPFIFYLLNVRQNDFNKVYRAKTPIYSESKSEIRSSKSETNRNTQIRNPKIEIRNKLRDK
jgi:hypothetical protein